MSHDQPHRPAVGNSEPSALAPRGETGLPIAPGSSSTPGRTIRNRRGARNRLTSGETVTLQLRDARMTIATVVDESAFGLSLLVAEPGSLGLQQSVIVRRRGFPHRAVVRYVQPDADHWRIGLSLSV